MYVLSKCVTGFQLNKLLIILIAYLQITLTSAAIIKKEMKPAESEILLSVPTNSSYLRRLLKSLGSNHNIKIVPTTISPLTRAPDQEGRKYLGLTPPYMIDDSHYIVDVQYPAGPTVKYDEKEQYPLVFGTKVLLENMLPISLRAFIGGKDTARERAMMGGASAVTNYPFNRKK